jgi:hypothetical protein
MWAAVWAAFGAVIAAIVAGGVAWWNLKQTIKAQASTLKEQITFQGKRDTNHLRPCIGSIEKVRDRKN